MSRSFEIACPFCGDERLMHLSIEDCKTLECGMCYATLDPDEIRELIAEYRRWLQFLGEPEEVVRKPRLKKAAADA